LTVHFPAFCPHCGAIFQSQLVAIEGGGTVKNLTLAGNTEPCPNCGRDADTIEGTFDVVGETIHVLSASKLTREGLLRLQTILEAASAGNITEEAATQAIAAEDPELASFIARLRPKMGKALIWFLLAIVQILVAQAVAEHRSHAVTPADVQRAVERAVEVCQQHAP
jgi:hypothetical protein